jgi:predicted DNA-binding ribbon-helix-helix protein
MHGPLPLLLAAAYKTRDTSLQMHGVVTFDALERPFARTSSSL